MDRDCDFSPKATADIFPYRFTKLGTAADDTVTQAAANDLTIGISAGGTQAAPGTAGDDGTRAKAGQPCPVYGPGRKCLLDLGTGGAVRGVRLISDANGKGVAAATTGATIQEVGARALQSGPAGARVLVLVEQYPHRPALS